MSAVISEFKVHEMRQRPGLRPGPDRTPLRDTALPRPLSWIRGRERDKEREELGKEGRETEGKGGEGERGKGGRGERETGRGRGEREEEIPDQVSREIDAPGKFT